MAKDADLFFRRGLNGAGTGQGEIVLGANNTRGINIF